MNQRGTSAGRVLGTRIRPDYPWFLVFALVAWTLAVGYFPGELRNWSTAQYWVVGIGTAIVFFVSVILHGLGHSVVAMRYTIPVSSTGLSVFLGVPQVGTCAGCGRAAAATGLRPRASYAQNLTAIPDEAVHHRFRSNS